MSLKTHYVIGTTASFSHTPPIVNLTLSLLTETPDLLISLIIHTNNLPNSQDLADLHPQDVQDRLKFYPLGEKTSMSDATGIYMTMVYKSGEAYGQILGVSDQTITSEPKSHVLDIQPHAVVSAFSNPTRLEGELL